MRKVKITVWYNNESIRDTFECDALQVFFGIDSVTIKGKKILMQTVIKIEMDFTDDFH